MSDALNIKPGEQQPVTLSNNPEADAAALAAAEAAEKAAAAGGANGGDEIAAAAKAAEDAAAAEKAAADKAAADAKAAAEAAGADAGKVDFAKYSSELTSAGALSEASYAELAAKGFDKATVDTYVSGLQAKAQLEVVNIKAKVGGEEGWNAMAAWALSALSDAELEAFNQSTSTGTVEQRSLAVQGLYARFQAAEGSEPSLVNGSKPAAGGEVFESNQQAVVAMRDPRYKNDPAFRAAVQAKLARSNVL